MLLPFFERFQDERFLFRAHPFQLADPSVFAGGLQLVERAHAELRVQLRDRLGPDALQMKQIQDGRRKLFE